MKGGKYRKLAFEYHPDRASKECEGNANNVLKAINNKKDECLAIPTSTSVPKFQSVIDNLCNDPTASKKIPDKNIQNICIDAIRSNYSNPNVIEACQINNDFNQACTIAKQQVDVKRDIIPENFCGDVKAINLPTKTQNTCVKTIRENFDKENIRGLCDGSDGSFLRTCEVAIPKTYKAVDLPVKSLTETRRLDISPPEGVEKFRNIRPTEIIEPNIPPINYNLPKPASPLKRMFPVPAAPVPIAPVPSRRSPRGMPYNEKGIELTSLPEFVPAPSIPNWATKNTDGTRYCDAPDLNKLDSNGKNIALECAGKINLQREDEGFVYDCDIAQKGFYQACKSLGGGDIEVPVNTLSQKSSFYSVPLQSSAPVPAPVERIMKVGRKKDISNISEYNSKIKNYMDVLIPQLQGQVNEPNINTRCSVMENKSKPECVRFDNKKKLFSYLTSESKNNCYTENKVIEKDCDDFFTRVGLNISTSGLGYKVNII